MSKSRAPLYFGLAAAGGVGYYLYSAGGDPKVARKEAEADAHKLSSKVKGELPGQTSEAEKRAEAYGAQAGAKLDNVAEQTKAQYERAKADAEAYAKDVRGKVDEFDRKVETEASKAKSSISGWFSGSGK